MTSKEIQMGSELPLETLRALKWLDYRVSDMRPPESMPKRSGETTLRVRATTAFIGWYLKAIPDPPEPEEGPVWVGLYYAGVPFKVTTERIAGPEYQQAYFAHEQGDTDD